VDDSTTTLMIEEVPKPKKAKVAAATLPPMCRL
jgi:hypothetical protein